MPDKRAHRGPHPSDEKLFALDVVPSLRLALADFSLLLSKGYADKSALKLVGDKFSLTQRQRLAVMRSACSDKALESRKKHQVKLINLENQSLVIDGYNILITIEAAMSGGVIFKGRDGCFRDLASIHGTYRKVAETIPALELIGKFLQKIKTDNILWLLDSPVSNSGRLKTIIGQTAHKNNWKWKIELVPSPDTVLKRTEHIVVSSDSVILDECQHWLNLAAEIITNKLPDSWIVDLSG